MGSRQSQKQVARPKPSEQQSKLNQQLQPPHDKELEDAVLGAILLEKETYQVVCDILDQDSFYDDSNRMVYKACQDLASERKPIDMLTVTDQLTKNGDLEAVGGPLYIAQLARRVSSGANAEFHARIVAQKHIARQLIRFGDALVSDSFDESKDVDDILRAAETCIFEMSLRNVKKDVRKVDGVYLDAMLRLQELSKKGNSISGISTGYPSIDKFTSGWQASDLIIIAARPSMGKSALAQSMAYRMSVVNNIPIALFSLEMSNIQLANRLMSIASGIDSSKIRDAKLREDEWPILFERANPLAKAPLYLDETSNLSVFELQTKARKLVREHQVKVIIIDYLQLMNASGAKFYNREQEVSIISRTLKQLAKELNIPIIALSQLNRSVENRGDGKRPQLSDLRESGAIEQDADIVCLLHRPEYYLQSGVDASGIDITGQADLIIAKNRSGEIGDIRLTFEKNCTRFVDPNDIDYSSLSSRPRANNANFTPF